MEEIFMKIHLMGISTRVLEDALKENKIEAVSRPDIDVKQIGKDKT